MCIVCDLQQSLGFTIPDPAEVELQQMQQELLREKNPSGRSRPVHRLPSDSKSPRAGKLAPVPWVGGPYPHLSEWARVDSERSSEAQREGLCIVCGEALGDFWLYSVVNDEISDTDQQKLDVDIRDAQTVGQALAIIKVKMEMADRPPAPTWGHPHCLNLAALYCPHLSKQTHPAVLRTRVHRISVQDLKTLAKFDQELRKADLTDNERQMQIAFKESEIIQHGDWVKL